MKMNLKSVIEIFDKNESNDYSEGDKLRWLSELDGKIKISIIDRYVQEEAIDMPDYTAEDTDLISTQLLAAEPFTDLYFQWLRCKVNQYNGEVTLYNAAVLAFNSAYYEFSTWYTRNHLPINNYSFRNYKGV